MGSRWTEMSPLPTLVKLPCIAAMAVGIHTTFTLPGRASKAELILVPALESKIFAFGVRILATLRVSQDEQL